jgi:hypothetical protein
VTAPGSVDTHATAVLAALVDGGLAAYDGQAPPGATGPRVVVYFDAGADSGTLGDRHRWLLVEFQATAVGTTPKQARWASDKTRAVLLTAQLVVPGRSVSPLWQVGAPPPIQRDDDVTPPLFYQPVSYQFRSGPA